MDRQSIYAELKARIEASGVAQNRIAAATGVKQPSISRFLAEKTGLSADSFLALLAFVGGDVSFYKDEGGVPCAQALAENAELKTKVASLEGENKALRDILDRVLTQDSPLSRASSAGKGMAG